MQFDPRTIRKDLIRRYPQKGPVTLTLPEELYKQFQAFCKRDKLVASDVVAELITQYLSVNQGSGGADQPHDSEASSALGGLVELLGRVDQKHFGAVSAFLSEFAKGDTDASRQAGKLK